MADLTNMDTFLKSKHLKTGDVLEFLDAGDIVDIDVSKKKDGSEMRKVFQVKVSLNGGEGKLFTVNGSSRKSLSEAWGTNTDNWIGKKAKASFVKTISFGEVKDVLLLIAA